MDFQHTNVPRTHARARAGGGTENLERRETTRASIPDERVEGNARPCVAYIVLLVPRDSRGSAIAIGDYVNQTRAVHAPAICLGIIFP